MPLTTNDRRIGRLNLVNHLTSFPAPPAGIAARITGHDVLAVRRDGDINRVSGVIMASERFLAVLSEALVVCVDDDLVVRRLESCECFGWLIVGLVRHQHVDRESGLHDYSCGSC